MSCFRATALFLCFAAIVPAQKPGTDPLGRLNPRSTVTEFLESCHSKDYSRAAQYLDTGGLPARTRTQQSIQLAKDLESLLNADTKFDVLKLSQNPQGNLSDDSDPSLEDITTIQREGQDFPIKLQHVQLNPTTQVWLFSRATVSLIPKLAPQPTPESSIAARLPRFLVTTEIFDTALWQWIALLLAALIIVALFRFAVAMTVRLSRNIRLQVVDALLEPILLFCAAVLFRVAEEFIAPSTLSRIYIGDTILLVVVAAFAWALVNLVEIFLRRVDSLLDPRQRVVSHSLIYLGRRGSRIVIFAVAAIFVLNNWGYPMTTIIAGLGVGGIAIALAAQQTIANVFGGVSVIGDHPVMVGDFGNFGGIIGTVDDIGMRSTRVRTLARTIVSIPNSAFAGMNLENYSLRDKILFNPTLAVKRGTPKAQLDKLTEVLESLIRSDKRIGTVPTPVRITGLTSAALNVEIFCYVLTPEIEDFYRIASELYVKVDEALIAAGVELA